MLKRLEVKHFKSLDDFSIDFEPLTVLIGQNGSGKTTVLQALDLLGAFLKGDVNHYLRALGWNHSTSLKSQSTKLPFFGFTLFFRAEDADFEWRVQFNPWVNGGLQVWEEELRCLGTRFSFRSFPDHRIWHLTDRDGSKLPLPEIVIEFHQSILRAFKIKDAPLEIEIAAKALEKILFLNIDSTNLLRKPSDSQDQIDGVGRDGQFLAPYLFSLIEQNVAEPFNALIRKFIPQIKCFKAKNESGRVTFSIEEKFPNGLDAQRNFEIFQEHVSEGTLRILTLLATIHSSPPGGILLLDEIENAVDPNRLGLLVEYLEEQINTKNIQIVLATHSPVLVNYTNESGIRYFNREDNGNTVAKKLFDRRELKKMLNYMNPGEIWLNLDEKDLVGREE